MLREQLRRIKPLRRLYSDFIHARYAVREGFWQAFFGRQLKQIPAQKPLRWKLPLKGVTTVDEFKKALQEKGVVFREGSLAIYIPPAKNVSLVLGEMVEFYPRNAGFKLLKDLRAPEKANYLAGKAGPSIIRQSMAGTPHDQMIAANFLHQLKLGPRIFDLCCVDFGGGVEGTIFVSQDVRGTEPTDRDFQQFIGALRRSVEETPLRITQPNWESKSDFIGPSCNGNLLIEDGQPHYVDFQNFRISNHGELIRMTSKAGEGDLHFGQGREWRGEHYLYQSIPGVEDAGKRNTAKRWNLLSNAFSEKGLAMDGRLILDIGCNSGMILAQALASGAGWALGWDRPHVAPHAERILLALGFSRVTLTPALITSTDYSLRKDIPNHLISRMGEGVIFYLSVREHIGMLAELATLPWRALVYEGHQKETMEQAREFTAYLQQSGARTVLETFMADGDSSARPLMIFLR